MRLAKWMLAGVVIAGVIGWADEALADVRLEGRVVHTPGHVITLDDTGLPAQIEIRVAEQDLPLVWRGGEPPSESALRRIGRGPQLHAPLRIEAVIDGEVVVLAGGAPSVLKDAENGVESNVDWRAGPLRGKLEMRFTADGAIMGRLRCESSGRVALERMELVVELAGAVDTVLAGDPVTPADGTVLAPDFAELPDETAVLWRNGPSPVGGGIGHAGLVRHFFLGNGDRGFTWLAHDGGTLPIAGDVPTLSVERNSEGVVVWRIALATGPQRQAAEGGFTLLTHPARPRATGRRVLQWQPWPEEALVRPLQSEARKAVPDGVVRADAGSVHEAFATRALLTGRAGGAAGCPVATLADRAPLALFRYLAGSHTALAVKLEPDVAGLVPAGGPPAADRMALGRALLHDIGVDIGGLSGRIEAANVLAAMERFGTFLDDGQTEFLPYWRTGGIVRYGEAFGQSGDFEITEENPAARARVSVYLRPSETRGRRKALFVLVNESTHELREQLYVLQPRYLFGGPNRMTVADIFSQLDVARIPEDSDWRPEILIGSALRYDRAARPDHPQLMDLENGGFVRSVPTRDGTEVYGLLHVPPRGMRVLFGSGR